MYKAKKKTKRWLRALEIAKTVFWQEGYHTEYLEDLEEFIRREKMYSPRIKPELVKRLYKLAKDQHTPMTRIVNKIISDYFKRNPLRRQTDGNGFKKKRVSSFAEEEMAVSEAKIGKYSKPWSSEREK